MRRASPQCESVKYNGSALDGEEDGFVKLEMTKVPDFQVEALIFTYANRFLNFVLNHSS